MVQRYFLVLLVVSYVLAAFWPEPGVAIRQADLGQAPVVGGRLTLPLLMLACLLFNAGLATEVSEVRQVLMRPRVPLVGLAAGWLVAFLVVSLLAIVLGQQTNGDMAYVVVGFALVAAMPVANSSTGWTQNTGGNVAVALALVLFSTLLSPLVTPLVMRGIAWCAADDQAALLIKLSTQYTGAFLTIWVIVPSLVGLFFHTLLGPQRVRRLRPHLKLTNAVVLLLLNYSNASLSLPQMLSGGTQRLWFLVLLATVGVCAAMFFSAWYAGRLLKADRDQRVALLFGIGMKNNGVALVLAGLSENVPPAGMLPIILCTLLQHVAAGIADLVYRHGHRIVKLHRDAPATADTARRL